MLRRGATFAAAHFALRDKVWHPASVVSSIPARGAPLMALSMPIRIHITDLRVLNMRTRMPFKYGIATLTALPHVMLRVEAEVDGERCVGFAADGLPPKWFTKDPATHFRDDLADMLAVIRHACDIAASVQEADTVFDLWQQVHTMQHRWAAGGAAGGTRDRGGARETPLPSREGLGEGRASNQPTPPASANDRSNDTNGYPPLLWGFGVSFVERAAIDAYCRAKGVTFGDALRSGALGVRLGDVHEELNDAQPGDLLPAQPLRRVIARHTVGLADPLTDADVPADERIDDGLPQSLEACIARYGLTHFKIKLCGDAERDIDRLKQLARIIGSGSVNQGGASGGDGRTTGGGPSATTTGGGDGFAFTLDGNEQYRDVEPFRELWSTLTSEPSIASFMRGLIFVEQPFHRDAALSDAVGASLRAWKDRPAIIIDESDGSLDSAARALALGYAGTSFKNCKGVFKAVANACLLAHRRRVEPGRSFILSGEDLANVGPIALLADLTVAANLGIDHVERNGHHYFRGLSMWPADVQTATLAAHGDVYRKHEEGFPTLDIRGGAIAIGSVIDAPFGVGVEIDTRRFTPVGEWRFDTMKLSVFDTDRGEARAGRRAR